MQPFPITFGSLVLIACLMPQSSRPDQILNVSPTERSTQAKVQYISAQVSRPTSLLLFVDGINVTMLSRIGNTRDGCIPAVNGCPPPSYGIVSYRPSGLKSGTHYVEVRYQTKAGKTIPYTWSFFVKSPQLKAREVRRVRAIQLTSPKTS